MIVIINIVIVFKVPSLRFKGIFLNIIYKWIMDFEKPYTKKE